MSGDVFLPLNISMNEQVTTPQITINDLVVVRDLIDLAATRGAFRASEMRTAGEVYDKLELFLGTVLAQAEANGNQQGEEE